MRAERSAVSSAAAGHPQRAERFLEQPGRAQWHDGALWHVREKRDRAVGSVPEWEELRAQAAAIKAHTLSHLAGYLEQFERQAIAHGACVHWARDAAEHNRIVAGLLASRGVTRVVKSKSMLTEECGLNPYLEARGFEVKDTDLGEFIVQLRREPPSHIVLPAIHLKREQVGETFEAHLGSKPSGDPAELTEAARGHLRQRFLGAQAAITGVNFAIAETGGIVVCTNEGNADLGTALAPIHIASMGLEKVIPRAEDLGVLLRLLARSATGQAITAYTSHLHGPRPGQVLHIVLVDNGRSALLAEPEHRAVLQCIRCGACLNTCPVYRRSGGHSYATEVPGPIGSILAPLKQPHRHDSLPFACSLCGSCTAICPAGIDLHPQLLALRERLTSQARTAPAKRLAAALASSLLQRPKLFAALGWVARRLLPRLLRAGWEPRISARAAGRALPVLPARSFHEAYRQRLRAGQEGSS